MTFILPTRNRADILDKALERCRGYKGPEDELIVIDGVSTDYTKEVVKKYADIIDVFISEPDLNCTHALNKGILLARGKYIKPLTDDDIFFPDPHALERVIEIFERHPEIDLLLTGGLKTIKGVTKLIYVPSGVNYGESIYNVFRYPMCGGSQHFRKRALANAGLVPQQSTRPDAEHLLRFFHAGATIRFCRLNTYNCSYSPNKGNLQSDWRKRRERRKFWEWAVREFFPTSFARKYIWINRFQRSLPLRFLRRSRRAVMRLVRRMRGGKEVQIREAPIWDGGLS